ncbi:hypothetical protein [Candidatus Nanobsidianus stetteri]|uniref:Uncharacterized protein n=1 Tax=Nanobsidianus stetteri TaxID=1294122 RepID=A0A2T9WMG3_NANST|nr:hypothetical protein [Candidatus Nanobsidianus stetteri]MCC5446999.1 hypothetical protein [Candidatus Nanobsidianus stetteri]
MKYCEEFLSRITLSRYPEVYEDLDIEKMRRIICENIDHLIRLKGEKAVEEMINNDVVTIYFRRLFLVKEILDIPKEFLTYIYLIREKFGKKILKRLIRILRKFEDLYQINTMSIIETIGKNIENLDKERIKVLLETLAYLIKEKYKLRIVMHTALSESLNLIVDKDIDIKIVRDFIIKVIGSFSGEPYLIIKLKDKIPKEKFVKLLNIFSSNGLYYKVQNEEDLILILNQVVRNPSIIDLIDNINFEKIKAKDFLFILTKYFENIYFNEKINQEIKLEIFNQLINKGGRIVRYIIIHTNNKKYNFIDYDKLYNVINLIGKDLFTKYSNILKYYPQFVSFRLYRLINSEKDLEYLENELNKRDPYELITDSKILEEIYRGIISKYSLTSDYLIKLLDHIVKKYGKKRKLITKILDAIEEINKFDKSGYLSTILAYRLFHIKDNIGKIGAWCNYFSHESTYYKWILINFTKKIEKMSR